MGMRGSIVEVAPDSVEVDCMDSSREVEDTESVEGKKQGPMEVDRLLSLVCLPMETMLSLLELQDMPSSLLCRLLS